MIFNSFDFLMFFPIVTLVSFLIPRRVQWIWLLVSSYYFYMSWNLSYAMLIAGSTVITYGCALLIERMAGRGKKRAVMALGLLSNLGILFFFKYAGFAGELAQRAAGVLGVQLRVPRFDVLLPVGISFYTFQALSYMIDVYRGKLKAERNLFRYALFVSFFPQLVAGPIERSANLLPQIRRTHDWDWDRVYRGLSIMMLGFFEKLVVADRACLYVDAVYGAWERASGAQLVLATAAFAFQIYGDFGGYSHIAIGTAKVLGFDLMENFRQPYFAVSVRDFWRRWHISLSTWFKDYVYIPLGGSRVGRIRHALNLMVTFVVSGLWHGASLNYVVWGGINGAVQVAEMLADARSPRRRRGRLLHTLLTFVVICVTWVFFRASSLTTAVRILLRMVTHAGAAAMETGFSAAQGAVLLCGIVLLLGMDAVHERGLTVRSLLSGIPAAVRCALAMLSVLLILVFGVWGSSSGAAAFIYFQF